MINKDIVKHLVDDDIVIADVTDENSNVFYELRLRNAVKKPVIIFKRHDQKLPFDIQNKRALQIDIDNVPSVMKAIEDLKEHVKDAELNPNDASKSIFSEYSNGVTVDEISKIQPQITSTLETLA